jgi:hypothetical protein
MGGYELAAKPVQLRTEIKENDLTHIIHSNHLARGSGAAGNGRSA